MRCLVLGHVEPMDLHSWEKHGTKARMKVRRACARCGEPLEERTSAVTQFPQPDARERAWLQ